MHMMYIHASKTLMHIKSFFLRGGGATCLLSLVVTSDLPKVYSGSQYPAALRATTVHVLPEGFQEGLDCSHCR